MDYIGYFCHKRLILSAENRPSLVVKFCGTAANR